MPVTSKVQLIRQVLSALCKGPGFDTIWSKVLNEEQITEAQVISIYTLRVPDVVAVGFQVPRPLSFSSQTILVFLYTS